MSRADLLPSEKAQLLAQRIKRNPRTARIIAALMSHPFVWREQIDEVAGASNGPEEVRRIRGLGIPCERVPTTDRDGRGTNPGRYRLDATDRATVRDALALLAEESTPC